MLANAEDIEAHLVSQFHFLDQLPEAPPPPKLPPPPENPPPPPQSEPPPPQPPPRSAMWLSASNRISGPSSNAVA